MAEIQPIMILGPGNQIMVFDHQEGDHYYVRSLYGVDEISFWHHDEETIGEPDREVSLTQPPPTWVPPPPQAMVPEPSLTFPLLLGAFALTAIRRKR